MSETARENILAPVGGHIAQLGNRIGTVIRNVNPLASKKTPANRLTRAWLLVIDPQVIFADPTSEWAVPRFDDALAVAARIAPRFGERVLVTRWLPAAERPGSWQAYFERWPFADRSPDDPLFNLVPAARGLSHFPTIDRPTFSKWGRQLQAMLGPVPHLVLSGCATSCCVLATALAAADAGATVRVVADACADSSDENHTNALHVMGLYDPQIKIVTSDDLL